MSAEREDPELDVHTTSTGIERDEYDPAQHSTYLGVPLRIRGQTAEDAERHALAAVREITDVLRRHMAVGWVGDRGEAAFALIAAAHNALTACDDRQRRLAVQTSGDVARDLRAMLDLYLEP